MAGAAGGAMENHAEGGESHAEREDLPGSKNGLDEEDLVVDNFIDSGKPLTEGNRSLHAADSFGGKTAGSRGSTKGTRKGEDGPHRSTSTRSFQAAVSFGGRSAGSRGSMADQNTLRGSPASSGQGRRLCRASNPASGDRSLPATRATIGTRLPRTLHRGI